MPSKIGLDPLGIWIEFKQAERQQLNHSSMKPSTSLLACGLAIVAVAIARAGEPVTTSIGGVVAENATPARPVKLPYGVEDVLKLSRAHVSEDIILTYIKTSGTIYDLRPHDIVYLGAQGVSDRVVNVMLEQRNRTPETQAASAQTFTQEPAPASEAPPPAATTVAYPAPAPVYVAPPCEPAPAPVSTLYIIPYTSSSYAYRAGCYSRPYTYFGYSGSYCVPSIAPRFCPSPRRFHSFHHR
jgi:hypothetical protein